MRSAVVLIFLLAGAAYVPEARAQHYNYTPRATYRSGLKVIGLVEKAFDDELKTRYQRNVPFRVAELNSSRKKHFRNLIENTAIIDDDTLQTFVESIIRRIEERNQLPRKNRVVFIAKDPAVNAFCLGAGVLVVNTGLLARIDRESQLAFTLAHEIAHDELAHAVAKIQWLASTNFVREQKARITAVFNGNSSMRHLQQFRELNFAYYAENRAAEFEADSLGLIFFRNAGYPEHDAPATLKMLEEGNTPKYPLSAAALYALDAAAYPFAEHWLNPRLKVFSKKLENSFLFNLDSLSSHPAIEQRMQVLENSFLLHNTNPEPKRPNFDDVIRIAEFEAVESAFFQKKFDWCLLQALMLWQKYPRHPYLVNRIGGVFLQLAISKEENTVDTFVAPRVVGYSGEQVVMNNFLHNITLDETKKILYHFISDPRNFDENSRDHHYVRWKICELTYRNEEAREIERMFRTKFRSGVAGHDYRIESLRKLNILDMYKQWGWVFL